MPTNLWSLVRNQSRGAEQSPVVTVYCHCHCLLRHYKERFLHQRFHLKLYKRNIQQIISTFYICWPRKSFNGDGAIFTSQDVWSREVALSCLGWPDGCGSLCGRWQRFSRSRWDTTDRGTWWWFWPQSINQPVEDCNDAGQLGLVLRTSDNYDIPLLLFKTKACSLIFQDF